MSAQAGKSLTMAALAIGIVAIIIGGVAVGTSPLVSPPTAAAKTQKFKITLGEGEIIGTEFWNGTAFIEPPEEELTGEYHRWEPDTLVVKKGDTVELTVQNPRSNDHSLVLVDFAVDTGELVGHHGATPRPAPSEKTVTFVASKAGIFKFQCGTPHNHATGDCDADHARMVGYLIVLE